MDGKKQRELPVSVHSSTNQTGGVREMKRNRLWRLSAGVVVGLTFVAGLALAEDVQGTTKEQLAELELPQPSDVRVALLPLWDYKNLQRHVEDCRETLTRRFGAEGFLLVHPAIVGAETVQDRELEPGEPMRRGDAIRLGTALGADWAVYGNILELETYRKTSFLTSRKKAKASIKLTVVDVATGNIIFWRQRFDTTGGTGIFSDGLLGTKKATSLERRAVDISIERILQDIFAALPEHGRTEELGPDYTPLDRDEARAGYEANPQAIDRAIVYGQALLCWQLPKEAEEVLGQGVRYHRDSADARFWHGIALYAIGDTDRAIAEWDRALEIDPTHELAVERLQTLENQQQSEE